MEYSDTYIIHTGSPFAEPLRDIFDQLSELSFSSLKVSGGTIALYHCDYHRPLILYAGFSIFFIGSLRASMDLYETASMIEQINHKILNMGPACGSGGQLTFGHVSGLRPCYGTCVGIKG